MTKVKDIIKIHADYLSPSLCMSLLSTIAKTIRPKIRRPMDKAPMVKHRLRHHPITQQSILPQPPESCCPLT